MDIKCPYCKEEQGILEYIYTCEHEEEFFQDCIFCKKKLKVVASVEYSGEAYCLDTEHDMQQNPHDEKILICGNCDHFEGLGA